jgi:hypothetical protein
VKNQKHFFGFRAAKILKKHITAQTSLLLLTIFVVSNHPKKRPHSLQRHSRPKTAATTSLTAGGTKGRKTILFCKYLQHSIKITTFAL